LAAAATLTSAAPSHLGPEFGSEQPFYLLLCMVGSTEERDELLRSVAPIHVDGE